MRRFTRLTNAFSKKIENHVNAISLHFAYYNFVKVHKTLRMSPAMAAGVTDRLGKWLIWSRSLKRRRLSRASEALIRSVLGLNHPRVRFINRATPSNRNTRHQGEGRA